MKKTFNQLSIIVNVDFTLYKSVDAYNTGRYFTESHEPSFFYLLVLEYQYGKRQFYIKYPDVDFFTELNDDGETAHGNMRQIKTTDVWQNEFKQKIELLLHDDNSMIKFGTDFNFLHKVKNESEIDDVLSKQYLILPDDIMVIAYSYKFDNKYIVVYFPKYYHSYDNYQFYIVENLQPRKLTIGDFERYRDGGTTIIRLVDADGEHEFISPTPTNHDREIIYDGVVLEPMTEIEINNICAIMNIKTT